MFVSVFDLFKIGLGPSSSHTMGPMVAAKRFLDKIANLELPNESGVITVTLYGSLSFTGKGHGSDRAIMLGLLGHDPATVDIDSIDKMIKNLAKRKTIKADGRLFLFDPARDLIFDQGPALKAHPNGIIFTVGDDTGEIWVKSSYYSIGGGFVLSEDELKTMKKKVKDSPDVPYPFNSAKEMLQMAEHSGLSIAQMQRENERSVNMERDVDAEIVKIWDVMNECMRRGLQRDGNLPGGLNVKRRAAEIKKKIEAEFGKNDIPPHVCNEWLSVYAMAVNEENAAGGRVVTAPTNGAAGVLPSVLRYYIDFVPDAKIERIPRFILTAGAIGSIIKRNASISGAEVGCQGEVGSASAMAAAGLCAVMGGTDKQIENAAEIALEHHLGMTCDPILGLVQIPCIERNGLGAVKAVTAAALALRGDGNHFVPLDNCIETMRQTGKDMRDRYKETSRGGLAVNVIEC